MVSLFPASHLSSPSCFTRLIWLNSSGQATPMLSNPQRFPMTADWSPDSAWHLSLLPSFAPAGPSNFVSFHSLFPSGSAGWQPGSVGATTNSALALYQQCDFGQVTWPLWASVSYLLNETSTVFPTGCFLDLSGIIYSQPFISAGSISMDSIVVAMHSRNKLTRKDNADSGVQFITLAGPRQSLLLAKDPSQFLWKPYIP